MVKLIELNVLFVVPAAAFSLNGVQNEGRQLSYFNKRSLVRGSFFS